MLKKLFAVVFIISILLMSTACTQLENDTSVSSDTEYDTIIESVLESEDMEETTSQILDITTDNTEEVTTEQEYETQDSAESAIISDEEAIELFEICHYTSDAWRELRIYPDTKSDNYITYTSPDGTYSENYYPVYKENYTSLYKPDARGNTKIYYGDNDWMQENLRTIFTEDFIERYFIYEAPYPHLIYQDGMVYARPLSGAGQTPAHPKNYTILHKTENELAIMCEIYLYYYETDERANEIAALRYMKFVKEGDIWLIDEHYSHNGDVRIHANDPIPAEYDWVYKKYYEIMPYCEMRHYFEKSEEETEFDESKIVGTFKCVGKHYNGEFYKKMPEVTPQLSFYENGSCRLLIGYNGEKLYINGEYTISGREIDVVFDTANTPYSNPSGKANNSFYFKEDDLIEINSNFYGDDIKRGYGFVRDDNMMEVAPINATKNNTEIQVQSKGN